MAGRIRTLKPEWLEDEALSRLTDTARLLFLAGISLADDHGNLRASPAFLLGQAWWASAPRESVEAAVSELAASGLWLLYAANGQAYAHIRGWSKHQRIDNAMEPRIPLPPGWVAEKIETADGKRRRVRWLSRDATATMPGCQGLSPPDLDHRSPITDQRAAMPPRGAEADSLAPTLSGPAAEILTVLADASDLWPELDVTPVAMRTGSAIADPANRAKGEQRAIAAEAVADVRSHAARFQAATPEQRLARFEQRVTWLLGEYRSGKRQRADAGTGSQTLQIDDVAAEIAAADRELARERRRRAEEPRADPATMADAAKAALARLQRGAA